MKPKKHTTYTHRVIMEELELLDEAFLMVSFDIGDTNVIYPIQSHLGHSVELTNGIDNTEWSYRETTEEWIPIFHNKTNTDELAKLLSFYVGGVEGLLVTWKGGETSTGYPMEEISYGTFLSKVAEKHDQSK